MVLKFLLIFASLSVVLVVSSHARATPSPMIKLLTDLLQNDVGESEIPLSFRLNNRYLGNKYVADLELGDPVRHAYKTYGGGVDHLRHYNQNFTVFFLQKDLHEGKIMNLLHLKTKINNLFPRKIAESIPFSSKYLSEIFEKFSVEDESSKEAENIKTTLTECEKPEIEGEEKYCATSVESMIDFAVSILGKNIQPISTDAHEQTKKENYTISRVNKLNWDDEAMVCHKQDYPYAVFYCHAISKSEAFSVSMFGEINGGNKIEVAVVCHKETSDWDTYVPVCHFLPENHILWVRKNDLSNH